MEALLPADGRRAVRAVRADLQGAESPGKACCARQVCAASRWGSKQLQCYKGDSNEAGGSVAGRPHAWAARCSWGSPVRQRGLAVVHGRHRICHRTKDGEHLLVAQAVLMVPQELHQRVLAQIQQQERLLLLALEPSEGCRVQGQHMRIGPQALEGVNLGLAVCNGLPVSIEAHVFEGIQCAIGLIPDLPDEDQGLEARSLGTGSIVPYLVDAGKSTFANGGLDPDCIGPNFENPANEPSSLLIA